MVIAVIVAIVLFIVVILAFVMLELLIRVSFWLVAIRVFKVSRNPNASADSSTSELILDYDDGKRRLALFGFLAVLFWTASLIFLADASLMFSIAVFSVFMGLIGIPCLLLFIEFRYAHYGVGQLGIRKNSPWTARLFLLWSEIDAITYSASSGWFILRSQKGKIRLSVLLNGLKDFAVLVGEKVPGEKWAAAKDQIESLASGRFPETR